MARGHFGGRNGRFTLIELLVVVAVIAILASLLLPALSNARKSALLTNCASNLRNMGLILHMYAGEHEDNMAPYYVSYFYTYPFTPDVSTTLVLPISYTDRTPDIFWRVMEPYGFNGQIVQCPMTSKYANWKDYWMQGNGSRNSYFHRSNYRTTYGARYQLLKLTFKNAGDIVLCGDTCVKDEQAATDSYGTNHPMSNGWVESQNQLRLDGRVVRIGRDAYDAFAFAL